ncbi:hypothetical protein D1007_40699 [Hordeum vulgare]|nr:hypothetical protein D1007_40699 [Hordeum vulgare]
MGVQDPAPLGRPHPAFPRTLSGAGRDYQRPDYINPRGLTRAGENHTGTPTRRRAAPAGHHNNMRHKRDPTDRPRTTRYEQHYRADPRGWLRGGAQREYARGAHLLVGSCLRQASGSRDRGPLALDRVDAPSCPGRGGPAWGRRVEHTPMFPGQTNPTWGTGVVYPLPPRGCVTLTWGRRVEHAPMSPVQALFGYQQVFGYPSLPLGWAKPASGQCPRYQPGNPGGSSEGCWGIALGVPHLPSGRFPHARDSLRVGHDTPLPARGSDQGARL